MLKISRHQVQSVGSRVTFERGANYFNQGRVTHLYVEEADDNYVAFRAEVSGTEPYYQDISIEAVSYGVVIEGDCSCPVGYNCKHVVAACLAFSSENFEIAEGVARDYRASQGWLRQLAVAGAPSARPEELDSEFIAYLISAGSEPGSLETQMVKCKKNQKGNFTKGRKFRVSAFDIQFNQEQDPKDSKILKLLTTLISDRWYGSDRLTLAGEMGTVCLLEMIATKRCFWQGTQNSTLQKGDPRPMTLAWRNDSETSRLEVSVSPPAEVLNLMPPLYLDMETKQVGEITGASFNSLEWDLLLQAPVLATQDVPQFTEEFIGLLPNSPIPLPVSLAITEIRDVMPIPVLTLFSTQADKAALHFVELCFEYQGYIIPTDPSATRHKEMRDNVILDITRETMIEQQCANSLTENQFHPVYTQDGELFWITTPREQRQSIECWQQFLAIGIPQLRDEGWRVIEDDSFSLEFVAADNLDAVVEVHNDWFDLRFDIEVQGDKIPLLPLITQVLQRYELEDLPDLVLIPLEDGRLLELPAERIRPICKVLYELFDQERGPALAGPIVRLNRFDVGKLSELDEQFGAELNWQGGASMRKLADQLRHFDGITAVKVPVGLHAELREYQQQGLNWLQFLREFSFNGILADDMGLGKTVQALANLQIEKEQGRLTAPSLVVMPTSLVSNWLREANKFTPDLTVMVLHGQDRHAKFASINDYDLVLTTYPLLVRDHEALLANDYYYLILDEAQVIKNPRAKAAMLARRINAQYRLCLTGTPMENHLGELWALFDFLMPGFLSSVKSFRQQFRTPIEKYADDDKRRLLSARVAPFMLRRRKADVVLELPPKTEIILSVVLEGDQATLYESVRLSMEKKVRDAIKTRGFARSHITILDALLKLRQICCDPRLLSLKEAKTVKNSAKLARLMELLSTMLEEGRRILLFSQFTSMLSLIEQELDSAEIGYTKLTGQTKNRDAAIQQFRDGSVNLFLISLKAGGVGLNLTEADTVIHYDPWWNPAVEEQASDRAHRIGQDKAVFVYKLITENTLEEKILEMQARKQQLADGVYDQHDKGVAGSVTAEDLAALFTSTEY